MPEVTLEEIAVEVDRLTKEHLYTDPLSTFADTVRARDQIDGLLERRQYPKQSAELYYLAAIVCALLADISVCVGFPRIAEQQARACWAYAEIISHNSLRVEAKRIQAAIAYWGNRPQRALDLALSATHWATEPKAKAGLYNAIALFSALTGRPSAARAALSTAFDAHESASAGSELYDRLGGMFTYDRAKLLRDAATTHRELNDVERAEQAGSEAISLYEAAPTELRAPATEASARIDLGRTRLLREDGDGAVAALRPVLELPPSGRLEWLCGHLKDFYTVFRSQNVAISTLGRQLGEEIEAFLETTAASTFSSSDG